MPVEILNVPVAEPATTVTDVGAANIGDALSVKVTTASPAGATPESVTVHKVLSFDESVVSVQERAVTAGGPSSVSAAEAVVPFSVAVKVAV